MTRRWPGLLIRPGWARVALVFSVALVLRLVVAALFFGSVDVANSVRDARAAVDHVPVYLPYFPVVANMLFGVALVVSAVSVPLALAIKFLPSVSDALLAAWFLVDTRLPDDRRHRCAWFYATCPLSVILVSLHGQWDALWLLPMVIALALADAREPSGPGLRAAVLGVFAAVAVLFKPVPVALLPAVLPSIRRVPFGAWLGSAASTVAAFVGVLAVSLAWFAYEGFDIGLVLSSIRDYGATARTVVVMGLPRLGEAAGGLPAGLGLSVADYRLLAMAVAALVLLRYQLSPGRQGRFATAAAVCLVLQGVGGIAPQYLLWPLPFIVAAGRLRTAAWYAAPATLLLVVYYLVPGASVVAGENGGLFLPLAPVSWLAPPRGLTRLLDGDSVLAAWRLLANAALPLALLALAVHLLRRPTDHRDGSSQRRRGVSLATAAAWTSPPVLAVVACAALYVILPVEGTGKRLDEALPERLAQYAAVPPTLGPPTRSAPSGGFWPTTAPVLLASGTLVWAVCFLPPASGRRRRDVAAATSPAGAAIDSTPDRSLTR